MKYETETKIINVASWAALVGFVGVVLLALAGAVSFFMVG